MYTITKKGHPTEATAVYGTSLMRIVVDYDASENAYQVHLYVKTRPIDRLEARVPVHGRYADHAAAMNAAYGAGKLFIQRFARPAPGLAG